MPFIEKILPCTGGKSAVVLLSDGRRVRVYRPTLVKLACQPGMEAPEALLRIWEASMTADKARDYAAKLALRPIFSSEVREKLLSRGFSEEIAEDTVAWLMRIGAVNDEETLGVYLREAARKGKGSRQIAYDLTRRGVARETVEAAMEGYTAENAALSLLQKKLRGASDRPSLQKGATFLAARGFSREEISSVMALYLSELND